MKVCIVGAGVAGLSCALVLHEAGVTVQVLEAHARAGGRVRSARDAHGRHLGDLGPSWVWPPYQPVLASWLQRLAVSTRPQYEQGQARMERTVGQPPISGALPGQAGQHRPLGGPQAIVDALLARLPAGTVQVDHPVSAIRQGGRGVHVHTARGGVIDADAVVLAVPLRILDASIALHPPLPGAVRSLCAATSTWMASQAKALIVYDRPFWREAGLSGRIASALGPLVEAHDHTDEPGDTPSRASGDGCPGALIGFIGIDAATRERIAQEHGERALGEAVIDQLVRCFGAQAATPRSLHIEDWARDERIAAPLDVQRPGGHPDVLPAALRQPCWNGCLHLAVAETSSVSPGLLEGALAAGERAARALLDGATAPG